jgi:hypothetical protein
MIIMRVGHVTDMITLNSSSDNTHTVTLEEQMEGDSLLIKNTVYVMTALYGRVLMGHNVNQLDASLVSEL